MKRLQAVFSLIRPCGLFADIGTDHGHIAAYAAQYADKVVASDISEKCLNKARQSIKADNVEFVVGDGLSVIDSDPDVIAICGMGGHTIAEILRAYTGGAELILQPQNDAEYVRRFLYKVGYVIADDITAYEGGKYYDILRAGRPGLFSNEVTNGITANPDELGYMFGIFYKTKNALLYQRLMYLKQKYEGYKGYPKNQKILEMIEQALLWQK